MSVWGFYGILTLIDVASPPARVPLGLPISKKQTAIVMHVEYKVYLILCLISVAMKLKNYKLSFHFPHLTKVLYLVMRVKIFNNILYLILSR